MEKVLDTMTFPAAPTAGGADSEDDDMTSSPSSRQSKPLSKQNPAQKARGVCSFTYSTSVCLQQLKHSGLKMPAKSGYYFLKLLVCSCVILPQRKLSYSSLLRGSETQPGHQTSIAAMLEMQRSARAWCAPPPNPNKTKGAHRSWTALSAVSSISPASRQVGLTGTKVSGLPASKCSLSAKAMKKHGLVGYCLRSRKASSAMPRPSSWPSEVLPSPSWIQR